MPVHYQLFPILETFSWNLKNYSFSEFFFQIQRQKATVRLNDGYVYQSLYLKCLWREFTTILLRFFSSVIIDVKKIHFLMQILLSTTLRQKWAASHLLREFWVKVSCHCSGEHIILQLFCEGQENGFLYGTVLSSTIQNTLDPCIMAAVYWRVLYQCVFGGRRLTCLSGLSQT